MTWRPTPTARRRSKPRRPTMAVMSRDCCRPASRCESAQADAVAITGSGDATNLDRGLLNDRQQAIRLGQFDPATGQFAQGFGPPGGQGLGGCAGAGSAAAAVVDGAARRRPGGRGGFFLGGRGARGQSPYQGSATYTFGGSALDTPRRTNCVRTCRRRSRSSPQNNFGATFGGPLKIPGPLRGHESADELPAQLHRQPSRTTCSISTRPCRPTRCATAISRRAGIQLDRSEDRPAVSPATRFRPAASIRAPRRCSDSSRSRTCRARRRTTTSRRPRTRRRTPSACGSPRICRRRSRRADAAAAAAGAAVSAAGGRRAGGRGGPRPAAARTSCSNAQLQYRRNETKRSTCFPNLGGTTTNTSISAPISLNVARGRSIHNFTVNLTHATTQTTNAFAGVNNVGGAGRHPVSRRGLDRSAELGRAEPVVLRASRALRGASASLRTDDRLTTSYFWPHPIGEASAPHRRRLPARSHRAPRATRTRAAASRSPGSTRRAASPVAGQPAPTSPISCWRCRSRRRSRSAASTHLRQHSFDAYIEDNWQKSAKLTFNLGLRYELALPYIEANGQMANLDVDAGFHRRGAGRRRRRPVRSPAPFPAGLLNADRTTSGRASASRTGHRRRPILRGGYSITYNSGVVRVDRQAARRHSRRSPTPRRSPARRRRRSDARRRAARVRLGRPRTTAAWTRTTRSA